VLKPSTSSPADYTANNEAVLRANGTVSGGPAKPEIVRGLMIGLRDSGYLRPNPPTDSASLVAFVPSKTIPGTYQPYFVPMKPDDGATPSIPLPTRVGFHASAALAPGSGPLGGLGGISVSSGSGTGGQGPTVITRQTTVSAQGGYVGGPVVGGGVKRENRSVSSWGGEPYLLTSTSTAATIGFSPSGPTAQITVDNRSQGPDSKRNQTSVTAGVGVTGPVGQVKIERPGFSGQIGYNKLDILGIPVGSFVPGSWGAIATFRRPDDRNQWVLDKASESLLFYGKGEGKAAVTVGAVGVGPVGVLPVVIPGPDAIPQQRIKLPPEVVQSINARELSVMRVSDLDTRTVQRFASSADTVRQHLFEQASGGVSPLWADGTVKSRQELEQELLARQRHTNPEIAPLETAARSNKTDIAQEAQEKLSALRTAALQPIESLATPMTASFFPANAAVHVFAQADMHQQGELARNFEAVTGVSAFQANGAVKPREQLNEAVWRWFERENKVLVSALEERAASTNPAVARDAQQRLAAVRQVAVSAVAEPVIPTPDELRAAIHEQQRREISSQRRGGEKPWEHRNQNPQIDYRRPYSHIYDMGVNSDASVSTENGQSTATSRISLHVDTPDTTRSISGRAQRTGIPDAVSQTHRVTFEQQVVLSGPTPPLVTQHQVKGDLEAQETRLLQAGHNTLSRESRQNGRVDPNTVLSLFAGLPLAGLTPRGDVTSQRLSFQIPGHHDVSVGTSQNVQLVKAANGAQVAVTQIVVEHQTADGISYATREQVFPIPTDRPPDASLTAVRMHLHRQTVGTEGSPGVLQTAARNAITAVTSGQRTAPLTIDGFQPLSDGQNPHMRMAALVASLTNPSPQEVTRPASGPARYAR
jgi:hypothetical protein